MLTEHRYKIPQYVLGTVATLRVVRSFLPTLGANAWMGFDFFLDAEAHTSPLHCYQCTVCFSVTSAPSTNPAFIPSLFALRSQISDLSSFAYPSNKINHFSFASDCIVTTEAFAFQKTFFKAAAQSLLLPNCSIQALI